jgi:hypothetical protein
VRSKFTRQTGGLLLRIRVQVFFGKEWESPSHFQTRPRNRDVSDRWLTQEYSIRSTRSTAFLSRADPPSTFDVEFLKFVVTQWRSTSLRLGVISLPGKMWDCLFIPPMKLSLSSFCLLAATGLMATCAYSAQTIVAYSESAGRFNSTLDGTTVFDFNTLKVGRTKNVVWSGVGVFDQLQINAPDKWGGAGDPNGSNYSVQSNNTLPITTLTLTSYQSYFGFWWSGGDSDNVITFYSGSATVGQFTTSNFLNQIASTPDYYGNPTTGTFGGLNSAQPYAFVNFIGMNGTKWNKITFSNTSSSGYETDNFTVRSTPFGTLPGDATAIPSNAITFVDGQKLTVNPSIPEPSAILLGAISMLGLLRRKR